MLEIYGQKCAIFTDLVAPLPVSLTNFRKLTLI